MNLSINVIARNPEGTTKQSVAIAIFLNGLLRRIEPSGRSVLLAMTV